jgi:hypothetical protein
MGGEVTASDAPRYHTLDCIWETGPESVCFYRITIRSLGAEEAPSSGPRGVPHFLSFTVRASGRQPCSPHEPFHGLTGGHRPPWEQRLSSVGASMRRYRRQMLAVF